jgi:arginine decarboxylase
MRYSGSQIDQWHTPGHLGGQSLRASRAGADLYRFLGEGVFAADQSVSVPELDSLTYSSGVVLKAEQLASVAFGARRTYFCANGTSAANRIVLEALLRPGDKVLVDRACHQSVHDAMISTGAWPVYLECTYNVRCGLPGPVPKISIEAALNRHKDAKVLVLTSCTYDGLRYDLAPIVSAAHDYGLKVLIDEAWYAHARFHPALRPTALECGADYVTQSTHKTLSALSQASMIHVNDSGFDEHRFEEVRRMHLSSSPQYALLASLDVARRQAETEGFAMLSRALQLAGRIRERIAGIDTFRCLTLEELTDGPLQHDRVLLDPTKITLDVSASGYRARDVRQHLREVHRIQVEKNTQDTLSLLVTIGTSAEQVERLLHALESFKPGSSRLPVVSAARLVQMSELACTPREAFHSKGPLLPILDARGRVNIELIGRVCADQIVFYPPGIPVLVPGQVVTREAVDAIAHALGHEEGGALHGVALLGTRPSLRVM